MNIARPFYVFPVLLALGVGAPASANNKEAAKKLEPLRAVACQKPYADAQRLRGAIPDTRLIEHTVREFGGRPGRATSALLLNDGAKVEISALFPGGRLRRINLTYTNKQPRLSLSLDDQCRITEARSIVYDDRGSAKTVQVLSSDLMNVTTEIPLNPEVPKGNDPGGVSVGLIDSGVNYTLVDFNKNLARGTDGKLLGLDLWDGDDRPYDVDLSRSAFFPIHHGSAVMSVLTREAPMARVIPIRYPRPDMTRMAEAVDWLSGQKVRIVNLAMGSNKLDDWETFKMAAKRHPQMLFIISAGNNGRDIDADAVYPASLKLPNTIVVTSSEPDGRLANGSNWGATSVDIMVPGERVPVIDHRGAPSKASGSSFAVPRVTALAVRVLAKNPDWQGPEIRDWILKRGRDLPGEKVTRYGWIPDPSDGPH